MERTPISEVWDGTPNVSWWREVAEAEAPAAGDAYAGYGEGWPRKPLHQFTEEERAQFLEPHLAGVVFRRPARPMGAADIVAVMNAGSGN